VADEHAARIAAALRPLGAGADIAMPRQRLLLLCFSNRCGSNYLATLLAATGVFNEAGEFFSADTVLEHAAARQLGSLRAYVADLPALAAAVDPWLAAKASVDQLMMLADAGILDDMAGRLRYVLLERRDQLGQAISRCIAAQNGRWTNRHASRLPDTALFYDRAAIDTEIGRVALANAGFYAFFAANGIVPVHLAYEDLVADPSGTVASVGVALGFPDLVPDFARVAIRRQAGDVNTAWRARYLAGG